MIENARDFKEIFNRLPGFSVEEKENEFVMVYERFDKSFKIGKKEVKDLIENLRGKKIKDETILYDEYSYEVLIKFENSRLIPLRIFPDEEKLFKEDTANGITYELSKPTNEFLLFILGILREPEYLRDLFRPFPSHILRERIREEKLEFFEFLGRIMNPHVYTLKIKSQEPKSSREVSKLATAFLFNLSYNLNIAIIEVRFLDELTRYRLGKIRHAKPEEIEPPRRVYNSDLVYHYLMALSTDSIPLQFLSFYHIIEHFFYDVYHEELVNAIRTKITSPDFSYKRKRDIEKLVNLIIQKVKFKDEDVLYNEREALHLTLRKYIKLGDLIDGLREYDESLIEYYKNNKVSFSQGSSIDFSLSDNETVFKQIADRIYKTRNSIVHNKEGGKPKYMPFRNDKKLLQEIPLIRFISEEIIINTAEVIRWAFV